MKNHILYLALISIGFISSCDKIENPYPEDSSQAATCTEPTFDTNINTQRNVLLEDFTGHRCPNCPFATYSAIQLQNTLEGQGKHLIIVGEHVTNLAEPQSNPDGSFAYEFRTEAGDNFGSLTNSYSEFFGGSTGFSYVPIGLVDRANYNSSVLVDVGDWSDAINARFSAPIGANLQMKTIYDQVSNKACIYVETEFVQNLTGDFNMVIYVLEDSIVTWQINGPSGDPTYPLNTNIEFYMHRHVLRKTVSGTWGTLVASGSVAIGETSVAGFNVDLDPTWNANHISFVAYVYDDATKEILQTIEHHLIE